MSLVRGKNYAVAGAVGAEDEKFQVNHSVFILDATAGRGYHAYDGSDVPSPTRARKAGFGISCGQLAVALLALTFLLLVLITINAVRIHRLAYEVSVLEEHVHVLSEDNLVLDREILKARDLTRISYAAVQNLGMIPVEEAEIHYVTAPDTRPYAVRGDTVK